MYKTEQEEINQKIKKKLFQTRIQQAKQTTKNHKKGQTEEI